MLGCLVTTKVGKAQEANDLPDPPVSGLLPVFEPGMHVKPINAVGFTADGRRVVTVGKDLTVQIWDVKTGERLEILRLPGYGQEERLLRQIWETAAVFQTANMSQLEVAIEKLVKDRAKRIMPA